MKQVHLSENEVQQLAMKLQQADPLQAQHLRECAACKTAIASYQAIFNSLKVMEGPTFDFDVEQLVMPQLPLPQKAVSNSKWSIIPTIGIAVAVFCIPIFIMSRFLSNLAKGIPEYTLYIIIVTALVIAGFLGREMVTSYREKIRLLNFY
ncbi:hypothetical protein [[Flexibacter] sp. ATCC 35208]|uniref:hypothetical protein n=1 Tax=[Flexibacter] sp. ATCC 35208 TaxID=1936242 RepID=UPI0009C49206|nr:hypothetical protein [[Flexibacter] sp. ATCC 35208]OMP79641.1 hypothetical protein BW716_08700 [[Flexibacter] sp. ATCC 35208]